jgi:hypothetical protein
LKPVRLADNHRKVRRHAPLTIIGHPNGGPRCFSRDQLRKTNKYELQHAGPTSGGYSGGPCISESGDVLALHVGGGSDGDLNYAMRTSVVVSDARRQLFPRLTCSHGRQRSYCKECGGSSLCEHGRQRKQCKECGGGSLCEHGRRRSDCKECGGSSICEHGRQRHQCKECGGSSMCEHGRQRSKCKECGGGTRKRKLEH